MHQPAVRTLFAATLRTANRALRFAAWLLALPLLLLTGCGMGTGFGASGATSFSYQGKVYGGQQPVTGSRLQLYAVGTTGDGSAATPLISAVLTTSDGTGNSANGNANAGNAMNSLAAGSFTITGAYTCPSASAQVYLVATGGNPGLPAGNNNPALAMMAALGACGDLQPTTNVFIDELTTVGSIAPLAQYMNGYASLGSSAGTASQLLAAVNLVRQYTNTTNGTVPGPELAPGYYASQLEATTLGDILAACVNSNGTGGACSELFRLTTPPSGTAPTDTISAAINIIKYPANNAAAIYNLLPATAPFQPTLSAPPASWSLPIVPIAATPVITPVGGSYSVAPSITITSASSGATIRYTTDGSVPTASSTVYTGAFTLPGSATVRAIATGGGFASSGVASATYTLPAAGSATRLVFITQPGNPAAGYTIPSVRVGIADAYGTVVPVSGVTLTASLDNAGSATLGGTKTAVTAKDGTITFGTLTVSAAGTGYTLTVSAPGYASVTSAPFTVHPYGITLTQPSQVVGTAHTMNGTVTLGGAAPAGGTVVTLAIADTSIVTVSPLTVSIPEGSTTGSYAITGVATGQTLLTATATNYASQSLTQYDSASFVSFGSIAAVTPGVTVTTTLSLSAPAPTGGLTVAVASSNTASATITPATITFAAGATTSATTLSIVGRGYGSTDLSAAPASSTFGGDSRTVSTGSNSATLTATLAVPASGQVNDTITLASPAPTGGINFALTSSPTGIVNVPSFVFIAAGATSATFTVSAAKVGTATITATGGGLTSTSTTATTTGALNYYANVTGVGLDFLTVVSTNNTPSSPVTFTLTSSNPGVLLLASSNTGPGSASLTVSNVSVSAVNFYLRGVSAGTADVTISAPGYASVTATTTVYRPAVKFYNPGCCGGNTTSGPLTTQMSIYLSNSSAGNYGDCLGSCTVSPGAGFSVNVASTDTNIVTVQSPVSFPTGTTFATLTYTPVNAGTAKMQMTSTPAGFYDRTGTAYAATVNVGQSTFHSPGVSQFTTGAGVYITNTERLDYTPATPVTVTVTTSNPAIAVISSSASAAGLQTLTFPNITGTIPTIYLQGLQAGSTTLTYSAPGVADLTTTVNVNPAGVVFYSVNPLTLNTANTTAGTLQLGLAIYNSGGSGVLQYCYLNSTVYCALNPTTANATTLVSSDTNVGTISPNPVSLIAATQTATATFTVGNSGSASITIGAQTAPLSNNTSTTVSQVNATVTSPTLTLSLPSSVGASVYSTASAGLSPSPSTAKTMTLTVTDPTIALLSTTATALGSASISFTGVTSSSKTYYIQGLQAGTTTVKISAPGYTDGIATLTVLPTGVVFATGAATFSTTAFATARTLTLYLALLNPATGALQSFCSSVSCFANPGTNLSIPVASSNTSIGTITSSPVTFAAGTNTATTNFLPNDVGQTTIALGTQPSGLSSSSTAGTLSGVATVTGDLIDVSNTITGEGVYTYKFLGLPSSPGSYPVTVTVALADQTLGKLSTSETTMGTSGSLTFTLTSGLSLGQIFIQGLASGNTTLVVSARGYATGRAPVQVMKTGITFLSSNAAGLDLNLSAGNQNGTTTGLISLLDPVSLAWISDCPTMIFACKVNPGHSTDVVFGTANGSVASFSTSPVSINTSTGLTAPAPITVNGTGVTDFGVVQQPTGWVNTSTPYRSTGRIVVGDTTHLVSRDVDTAVGLQVQTAFTLSATNQASLNATFTATIADTGIATLSQAFGTAGGASVSAQGTGALGFTFYVQGKTAGTTTITFSGGGYTPRTVTVRVNPAGFVLKGPDVFRKLTNGNLSVPVTPAVLNNLGQWIADAVTNPGSSLSIPVASSDTTVGTIVTSPVALTGAVSGVNATFHPVAVGTTVLSVGAPSGFTAPSTYSSIKATVQ